MSDDKFNIHIDGKAIYKAVKNLLENDHEFRAKIQVEVTKQLADSNAVKEIVKDYIVESICSAEFAKKLDEVIAERMKYEVPTMMKEKFDNIFMRSAIDKVNSLLKVR